MAYLLRKRGTDAARVVQSGRVRSGRNGSEWNGMEWASISISMLEKSGTTIYIGHEEGKDPPKIGAFPEMRQSGM